MWLYRGPLVCFWIVEHHYPDRVLRQFDFPPLIPADPEVPRSVILRLHGIRHSNHYDRDWREYHLKRYSMVANMSANLWQMPEVDAMQFHGDPLLRYQAWYLRVGMASVYIKGHYGEFLRQMIFDDDGYTPTGRKGACQLLVALKGVARSIIRLGKRGYIAVGHAMLNLVAPCIEDHGHETKLITIL
ncbi:serine/threonine-protein phosphatase 7 long form homolog [Carex rostrata]